MSGLIRDDFAGAGGWAVAMEKLGLYNVLGVELDPVAASTSRANGHNVAVEDVRSVTFVPLWGYVASPPCQSFSMAGDGAGRRALDTILAQADEVASGLHAPAGAGHELTLHPLAVIRDQQPGWVALEQVPPVLRVWERYAKHLQSWGYSVVTKIASSEQYGVPQTRRRAILIASKNREVSMPEPTHSKYHYHDPERLDSGVRSWVSMGEALGDGYAHRVLRSNYGTGGDSKKRGERKSDQPAPTITGRAGRNKWHRDGAVIGKLELHEAALLQGFPKGYVWSGTSSQQYQQVGNAVPPKLAEVLISAAIGLEN